MRAGRLARFRAGENHSDMVLGFVLEFQFLSLIFHRLFGMFFLFILT